MVPTPQNIIDLVCQYFGVQFEQIYKKERGRGSKTIAYYRYLCLFLIKKYNRLPGADVAALISDTMDNTAVIVAQKKISRDYKTSEAVRKDVDYFLDVFGGKTGFTPAINGKRVSQSEYDCLFRAYIEVKKKNKELQNHLEKFKSLQLV